MTRAVTLAEIADTNTFVVDVTNNRVGIASTTPTTTLDVGGAVKATSFTGNVTGNATGLTGTPDISVRNITGVAATFTGVLTYEDVTNIDSIGIITARSGVSIGDSIFHTGDTNTAIRFPAADTFTVETAGGEAIRVDSAGRLLLGTTTEGEANADDLTIATSAHTGMTIRSGTANRGNIYFSDGTSGDAEYRGYVTYDHDGDKLTFGTANANRLLIDSSGRLLVGTTTEGLADGDNLTIADSGPCGITLRSGTSSGGAIYFSDATSGSGEYAGFIEYLHNSNALRLASNGAERMRILSDGTVATGGLTATPGTVAAGSFVQAAANAGFFVNGYDGKFGTSSNHVVSFAVNGSEKARIDTSGRLLVGSSSGSGEPIAAFQGRSTDANDGAMIALTRTGATPSGTIGIIQFATGSDYAKHYATIISASDGTVSSSSTPGMLRFSTTAASATSATERLRITSDGLIRIGMADFSQPPGTSNAGTQISNTGSGSFNSSAGATSESSHALFFNPNGLVGSIRTSGSATAFNTSSDYRLKENVLDIADGITRVKQLQPRRFNFIADDTTTVDGFIAHEAQAVVPEAVTGTKDEVNDDGDAVMQGIDQAKLVPLLTAALQEAIAKIETLETKVAALEAG